VSDPDARRRSRSENARLTEVLDLARRRQADAESLLRRLDEQLEQAKWAWRLRAAPLRPGQPCDSWIVEQNREFTKGLEMIGGVFAEITRVTRHGGMLLIEATGSCPVGEASRIRTALKAALTSSPGSALLQMHNRAHPEVGALLEGAVTPSGEVFLKAQVLERTAVAKTTERVYAGISIRFAGDEVDEVSLVDRDLTKLSKGAASDRLLAGIYKRGKTAMNISKARQDARVTRAAPEMGRADAILSRGNRPRVGAKGGRQCLMQTGSPGFGNN
jgi:hypothetical protein